MKKPNDAPWEYVLCPMCLSNKVLKRTWFDSRSLCLLCENHGPVVTLQLAQSGVSSDE